jgi:hypothetical protein
MSTAPNSDCFPRHIRVSRNLTQLFIDVGIRQPAPDWLQFQFLLIPSSIHGFLRGAMNSFIGNLPDPMSQLSVEVVEVRGFTTLKPTQEVPPHILHAGLDLSFRLGARGSGINVAENPSSVRNPKTGGARQSRHARPCSTTPSSCGRRESLQGTPPN